MENSSGGGESGTLSSSDAFGRWVTTNGVSDGTALSEHSVAQRQRRPVIVDQLRTAVRIRATFFGRFHPHAPERVQLRTENGRVENPGRLD